MGAKREGQTGKQTDCVVLVPVLTHVCACAYVEEVKLPVSGKLTESSLVKV